jgi:hypothetical protein
LLIGRFLDVAVLQPGLQTTLAKSLQAMPQRAALLASAFAVTAAIVDLALLGQGNVAAALDVFILIGASVLAVALLRNSLSDSKAAWGFATAVAFAVTVFVFNEVVPGIARVRSTQAKAAQLQQHYGQSPVMYFARPAHCAALCSEPSSIVSFGPHQMEKVGQFLQQHPEVILVTTPAAADKIRKSLGTAVELTAADARGRLYLAQSRQLPTVRVGAKAGPLVR